MITLLIILVMMLFVIFAWFIAFDKEREEKITRLINDNKDY